VSDGFFETMEIPLLMGREFGPTERLGSPMVVIVNRELARRAWPGESPLGKRITIMGPAEAEHTVVGVVGDVKQLTLSGPNEPQLYVAKAQHGGIFHSIVARVVGDPESMGDAVREAVWAVDRDQPVWKIRPMAALLDYDLAPRRFTARLTAGFAGLALVLALIGVYGVMSYVVAQRTREIGIRMALGAARGEVVRLVLGRGLRIVALGTALGLVAAYFGARVIEGQLFGVGAADLVTFVAVPLVLAGVAGLACWLPARRAARVDPVVALGAE
jgi:putative ABC transport system permease protein